MIRLFLPILCTFVLAACGQNDPSFVRLGDYENDAGEAVVRQIIKSMPAIGPGIPKEYCIVKALDFRSTDSDFVRKLADLKLSFVSFDVLQEQAETHFPINPKSGLSPVVLQIARMKKLGEDHYEVEGNWAWKKDFEKKRFDAKKDATAWKVTELEKLDGSVTSVAAPSPAPAPTPAK